MGFLKSFDISASGLTAQRVRMDVISNNIANANSTNPDGEAFRRQMVVLQERNRTIPSHFQGSSGVSVSHIAYDPSPPRLVYEPGHPHADENGYVAHSNVNIVREMTHMIAATRAYEANVTAINSATNMANKALEIGQA